MTRCRCSDEWSGLDECEVAVIEFQLSDGRGGRGSCWKGKVS